MNRTNIISFAFALISFSILVGGCSTKDDFFDGPNLTERFGEFMVIEDFGVSASTADFGNNETIYFTGQFNKNVNWRITIIGQSSGARKVITGLSRSLNEVTAKWNGSTTDLPLFKDETVTATLTIPEEPDYTAQVEISLLSGKNYTVFPIADFETPAGLSIQIGNFEFELSNQTGRRNDIPAGEGEWYWRMHGTDNVVPNFFVGLISILPSIIGETYFQVPTTIPEDLFFNCFIHHDGSPYGIAVIQFAIDSNNSGAFEDGQDQTFQLAGDFPLNWNGWRHFNHSMASVGLNQSQLSKIVAIRVLLISDRNAQPNPPLPVTFGIDFLNFTQGSPLQL